MSRIQSGIEGELNENLIPVQISMESWQPSHLQIQSSLRSPVISRRIDGQRCSITLKSEVGLYVFDKDSKKGHCQICNIALSSEQQAIDHLNSEPHQRNEKLSLESKPLSPEPELDVFQVATSCTPLPAQRANSNDLNVQIDSQNSLNKVFRCNECNVEISGTFNRQQHYAGKKHKKVMEKRALLNSPNHLYSQMGHGIEESKQKESSTMTTYKPDEGNGKASSSCSDVPDHLNDEGYHHKNDTISESTFKNRDQEHTAFEVLTHASSTPQIRNTLFAHGFPHSDQNKLLMCKECMVPFSRAFNMDQHFAGKKHKKEMKKRALLRDLAMQADIGQIVISSDSEETKKKTLSITMTDSMSSPAEAAANFQIDSNFPLTSSLQQDVNDNHESNFPLTSSLQQNVNDNHESNFSLTSGLQQDVHDNRESNFSLTSGRQQDILYEYHDNPREKEMNKPMKESSPTKFGQTLNENLNANNNKVWSLKDKKMIISDDQRNAISNTTITSSTSLSVSGNCQVETPSCEKDDCIATLSHSQIGNDMPADTTSIAGNVQSEASMSSVQQKEEPYNLYGSKGRCYICEVDLTSKQLARQHINGRRHRRKLNLWKRASSLQEIKKIDNPSSTDHSYKGQDNNENYHHDDTYHNFDGSKGFCHACKSELTSKLQANQHLKGKPHKRCVKRLRNVQEGKNYPLECDICHKSFSGQESASDHFLSDKHQLNEELLTDRSRVLEILEDGKKLLASNQKVWYFCEICRKPLNTEEMFEIHKRSTHHLSTLKSKRSDPNTECFPSDNANLHNDGPAEHLSANKDELVVTCNDALYSLRETTKRNSAVSRTALDEIKGLLTYGENPVVSAELSPKKSESRPNCQYSVRDYTSNCSDSSGNIRCSSNESQQSSLAGFSSCSDNMCETTDMAGGTLREISNEYEIPSDFENVVIGGKRSTNRGGMRDNRGQKNCMGLDQADEAEDTSDEEEDDTQMNIPGEEVQSSQVEQVQNTSGVPVISKNRVVKRKYYCDICDIQMNGKKSYNEHMEGRTHKLNLSNSKAPNQSQNPIVKIKTEMDSSCISLLYDITKQCPRSYQIELVEKAMTSDCVVYLPTGTGKTLVSVLAIGMMLKLNPKRPVIFLVDKVLLVIQQARYIKTQFEGKKLWRFSDRLNNGELVERELNLAFVCRDLLYTTRNMPIWQHDIIVTTADYCINMLNNGIIRWEDLSLAVLDEVHHCVKKHPYRRLIEKYHHKISDPTKRPKMLGLTASPLGKNSVEATFERLQTLLQCLDTSGTARFAYVEKNVEVLKKHQCNPILDQIFVEMTDSEQHFHIQCIRYFLLCYIKLAPLCSLMHKSKETPCAYFLPLLQDSSDENLSKVTYSLLKDADPLTEILELIFNTTCIDDKDKPLFESLRPHTYKILLLLAEVPTVGEDDIKLIKKEFKETEANYNELQVVKSLGLPYDIFYKQFLNFEKRKGNAEPSMIKQLMKILQDPSYIDWKKKGSLALLLVRERKHARNLAKMLSQRQFVSENHLRVKHLIGHGQRTQDGGMAVKQQRKIIDNPEKYQILVATSIAEEGVDLKTQLVVSMNPPSNVTALVQMRGRAREKGSHFIILCSNEEEMKKLDELKRQEDNMMEAVIMCNQQERN